jgi:hypothetical protein
MEQHVIPETFRRNVAIHLFKNFVPRPDRTTPLILGIHGPSGEGKTYQCEQTLRSLGVEAVLVSGGQLESMDAGEPAALVRSKYLEAAKLRAPGQQSAPLAALVFNDIDAAIGDWGPAVQYTVNRQTVFGELMHLADFPHDVDGRRVPRVPIIISGNDFGKLYAPLMRPGRMRAFRWRPDSTEKTAVLVGLYPELAPKECALVVQKFPNSSIAFFAAVRDGLLDDEVCRGFEQFGLTETFSMLARGMDPAVPRHVTLENVLAVAEGLAEAELLENHLEQGV